VFHPTEDNPYWVYVINELEGSIDSFTYSDTTGELTYTGNTVYTFTEGATGDKYASEIAISPSGKFVYTSTRYSTAGTSRAGRAPSVSLR